MGLNPWIGLNRLQLREREAGTVTSNQESPVGHAFQPVLQPSEPDGDYHGSKNDRV